MKIQALTLTLLAAFSNISSAEETYSAKALFFGEDDAVVSTPTTQKINAPAAIVSNAAKKVVTAKSKPTSPAYMGVSYYVRLKNADGSTSDVLSSRKFKSGERFQLGVKVNKPSYVYILNEDVNGKIVQLYPQSGVDNYIDAMGTVFLPAKGSFEFDNEPGTEKLLVYVSPKAMAKDFTQNIGSMQPDMISLARSSTSEKMAIAAENCTPSANQTQLVAANTNGGYAAKGISYSEDSCATATASAAPEYASKGISYSDSDEKEAASYVVTKSTNVDSKLYLKINLNHQ